MRRSVSCILFGVMASQGLAQEVQVTLGRDGIATVTTISESTLDGYQVQTSTIDVDMPEATTTSISETTQVESTQVPEATSTTTLEVPQETDETRQPTDPEDEEDEDDDDGIVIDPFTPSSRIEWIKPGIVSKYHLQNVYASGTVIEAEWKYTEPVVLKPDNLTLFRNKRPASNPPGKRDLWTEMETFPFVLEDTKMNITIGKDWLEGANYYFKLEANYRDAQAAIFEPQGKLITAVTSTSAPIRVYHARTGTVRPYSGGSVVTTTTVWTLVAGIGLMVLI